MEHHYQFLGTVFVTSFVVFNITKSIYVLNNRINLIENKITNIKEKISDLELFKAKVYNNEVIPGRRMWDQIVSDEEDDDLD